MMICFDMDGTLADLYGVANWLEKLRAEDESPYIEAEPMWDMKELRKVLLELIEAGHEVRIISWVARNSSKEYAKKVRQAKREWLQRYEFPYQSAHLVAYGRTKADCVRQLNRPAILVDDNAKVRAGWHLGETIDPANVDLVEVLKGILERK